MNSQLINALVKSILIAVLFPMIPTAVVGVTWLASMGGFEFFTVVRAMPMILLSGIMACCSIIGGIANFDDQYGL